MTLNVTALLIENLIMKKFSDKHGSESVSLKKLESSETFLTYIFANICDLHFLRKNTKTKVVEN